MNTNLKNFRKYTSSSISAWKDSLIYACLYAKDYGYEEESFKILKDNIKEISIKNGEEWNLVSSARTKVISCAKRICLAYPDKITTYEELLEFLNKEHLTSQKPIEKRIDKEGNIKKEEESNKQGGKADARTVTTDEERILILKTLYSEFDIKGNFWTTCEALKASEITTDGRKENNRKLKKVS